MTRRAERSDLGTGVSFLGKDSLPWQMLSPGESLFSAGNEFKLDPQFCDEYQLTREEAARLLFRTPSLFILHDPLDEPGPAKSRKNRLSRDRRIKKFLAREREQSLVRESVLNEFRQDVRVWLSLMEQADQPYEILSLMRPEFEKYRGSGVFSDRSSYDVVLYSYMLGHASLADVCKFHLEPGFEITTFKDQFVFVRELVVDEHKAMLSNSVEIGTLVWKDNWRPVPDSRLPVVLKRNGQLKLMSTPRRDETGSLLISLTPPKQSHQVSTFQTGLLGAWARDDYYELIDEEWDEILFSEAALPRAMLSVLKWHSRKAVDEMTKLRAGPSWTVIRPSFRSRIVEAVTESIILTKFRSRVWCTEIASVLMTNHL